MSITLTYGRKKPSDGDDSAQWFDNLEDNVDLDDSHDHDGVNSAKIDSGSIEKAPTVEKLIADWTGGAIGEWSLVVPSAEIPTSFLSVTQSSSELTKAVFLDTDNGDDEIFFRHEWANVGAATTLTIYSTVKVNFRILFI